MGTMPMLRLILTMSLPAIFSMLVQSLYNVVDSYFVAQVGQDALTAVSLAFPVQSLMIAFSVGTGVGVNSLVSRRLGEKRQEDADRAASHGLMLGIITALVFAVLGAIFTPVFFGAFTDNPAVLQMGCDYTYIVTIFCFGSFVQVALEKILQATGNMFYPMLFQLIGAITNIVLDPIMIFGLLGFPAMGVKGAAIATVLGQILAMAFSIFVIIKKEHDVHVTLRKFRFQGETVREIYRVGVPAIIMQSVSAVLTSLLNMILVSFGKVMGEAAVSVLGVYYKLQSFVFMPVFGLTQGLMPILGFNFGARKKKRIHSAMRYGMLIACIIMGLGTLLFELLPEQLLGMFNPSDIMLEIGVPAFRTVALCFIPAAVGIVASTLFQAIGMGTKSLMISILRQLVIILPAAWIFSKIGLSWVWWAFPLAEAVALIIALILMIYVYRKTIAPLGEKLPAHA